MAQLLQGKDIALKIKEKISKDVVFLKEKHNVVPALCAVQVGENAASAVYLKSQMKTAQGLGISYKLFNLDSAISEQKLIETIENLNKDKNVNGIILQLPLPQHLDAKKIISSIDPVKDAEGMHPENLGKILLGKERIAPCTACAVIELLAASAVNLYGKEAVVVGHSEIVGKPVALMLLNKFATTTVCHIATGERGVLAEHVKRAEILIVAVGKANLVKGDWIKEGAIVIDVGINRVADKIVGDVEFEKAGQRAAFITPVPGGVGPITVTILMRNLIEATKAQLQIAEDKKFITSCAHK